MYSTRTGEAGGLTRDPNLAQYNTKPLKYVNTFVGDFIVLSQSLSAQFKQVLFKLFNDIDPILSMWEEGVGRNKTPIST